MHHSFPHNKTQNITLLKSSNTDNNNTNPQLKRQLKKKQTAVLQAQQALTQKRIEMKKLSQNINKMVEKKYNKAPKERPLLYPGSQSNQKLNKLYLERDQILSQISQIKLKIKAQKPDDQSQLISQTLKKRALYEQILAQFQKNIFQVQFLRSNLQKGKKKIDIYTTSTVLKEISQNQKQLQHLKRQLKNNQKEYYNIFNQEVYKNMYYFQMKDFIDRFNKRQVQEINKSKDQKVDETMIKKEIDYTKQALQQRKKVDKQFMQILSLKKKQIQQQIQLNAKLEKQIRQIMNFSMKIDLQSKRYKSQTKRNSQSNLLDSSSQKKGKFSIMLQKKINQVEKKSMQLKRSRTRQQQQTIITIGNWFKKDIDQQGNLTQGEILSDSTIYKTKNKNTNIDIDRLKRINFILNQKRGHIYGIQLVYKDSYCKQIQGDQMVYHFQNNSVQKKSIECQDLIAIYYCSKCSKADTKSRNNNSPSKNSSNSNTSISFLKFQYNLPNDQIIQEEKLQQQLNLNEQQQQKNAYNKKIITIGNSQHCSCTLKSLKKINLESYMIKNIKILVFPYINSIYEYPSSFNTDISQDTPSYTQYRLKSMKIALIPKSIEQKIQIEEDDNSLKPSQRSFSVSDINKMNTNSVVMKKKVILRGRTLKKLSEQPQVDFRLMMNSRKKMV